jgi:hypothetical protein
MKLSINLYFRNGRTALATVEDECGHEADLSERKSPQAACLSAAKALRTAAARFELLAQEATPYQHTVQQAVNRKRITPTKETA